MPPVRTLTLTLLSLGLAAAAAEVVGWTDGAPAAATASFLASPPGATLRLPADLARKIRGPTLVVYFAPDCSHCQAVAPEVAALASELAGRVDTLGVATARTEPKAAAAFRKEVGFDFPVVVDRDAEFAATTGLKATPALVWVDVIDGEIRERARFAPFGPGDGQLVRMRITGDPWSALARGEFLGNATCASCHATEHQSWQLTHHSVAWRTLVLSGGSRDPACTSCHVTGAGQPSGWASVEDKRLVDVGCESCHSASGPHDGAAVEARSTCAGCHDAEHSVAFDVARAEPHIDHFRSLTLDPAAFDAARRALVGGEAARPMLAFAEAPMVGAAACAGCHPQESASWHASPHRQAMASLPPPSDVDPDCVRCHATANVPGPAPAALEGYRTEEGVGCESCHGPAGDHLTSGGAPGTILGLGDSCPVCVVEGICTSCHTPRWDPDWDLTAALRAISHLPGAGAESSP